MSTDYPRFMFHDGKSPMIVHSAEQEQQLGPGWRRTVHAPPPAATPPPPEPEDIPTAADFRRYLDAHPPKLKAESESEPEPEEEPEPKKLNPEHHAKPKKLPAHTVKRKR